MRTGVIVVSILAAGTLSILFGAENSYLNAQNVTNHNTAG